LQQVFWNLVNNAVKFTPVGGPITIRSGNVGGQNTIEIEVSDTGVGIEPQHLPRLFSAFEQGDTMRSRTFGGLGLGLAITKALVEAHGGTVIAHSAGRDAGATFIVRLPVVAEVQPQELEPAPQTNGQRRAKPQARVLLVEDHEETLQVLAKLLSGLGHAVTTASTINEALNAARDKHFDLVISDLGLPDGLGYDLMRTLRAENHLRGIALSGYGMSDDIHLSREAGFADHLVKPVDLKKLQEAMARVLAIQE
jgi:CheY-like chemotaxis protein